MKSNKLTIQIDKPAAKVFEFSINPANTPKWLDFIDEEQTSEWPVKVGTIYKNRRAGEDWAEMEVTEFEPNKLFALSDQHDGSLKVKYTFTSLSDTQTELEYLEWMEHGELASLTPQSALEKLKQVIESA